MPLHLDTRKLLSTLLLLFCVISLSQAQWSSSSSVNTPVDTASSYSHALNQTLDDGAGGVWTVFGTDGVPHSLRVQHLDYLGNQTCLPGGKLITSTGGGVLAAMVRPGSKNLILLTDENYAQNASVLYAYNIQPTGIVEWKSSPLTGLNGRTIADAKVVTDGTDGCFISWRVFGAGANLDTIFTQRLNSAGTPQWATGGVMACGVPGTKEYFNMVYAGNGICVIVWNDWRTSTHTVMGQAVNRAGQILWDPLAVRLTRGNSNVFYIPRITGDGNGNVYVSWMDQRRVQYTSDIYIQKVGLSGGLFWANDILVYSSSDNTTPTDVYSVIEDGAGGAYVSRLKSPSQQSPGPTSLYVHHISPDGIIVGSTDGICVSGASSVYQSLSLISDRLNGLYLSWIVSDGGSYGKVRIQQMAPTGQLMLGPDGLIISRTATSSSFDAIRIATLSHNGCTVVWLDARFPGRTIFAQKIDGYGYLGDVNAGIVSVHDIKNDQGGKVQLSWKASYLDSYATSTVLSYGVYRGVNPYALPQGAQIQTDDNFGFAGKASDNSERLAVTSNTSNLFLKGRLPSSGQDIYWQYMGAVNAEWLGNYTYTVPTLSDSGAQGNSLGYYMIRARSGTASIFWDSYPDSGYSVDNLAPGSVTAPMASPGNGGSIILSWQSNSGDPDVAEFRIHRSTNLAFVADGSNLIGTTAGFTFTDTPPTTTRMPSSISGPGYYYRIVGVDKHGNVGVASDPVFLPSFTSLSVSLRNNWNLVSVPFRVNNFEKDSLYPTATSAAYGYLSGYYSPNTLAKGNGYWVKFSGNQSVAIHGYEFLKETVQVHTGWNLIGTPSISVNASGITSIPGGIVTSQFFGYQEGYYAAPQLEPGRGYWVKSSTNGRLIVSGQSAAASGTRIRIEPTSEVPPPPPVVSASSVTPMTFGLSQNYPNPFNPSTSIKYQLAEKSRVLLEVYNVLGQKVATLVDQNKDAGSYTVRFESGTLPSGIYVYRLSAGAFVESHKLMITK